MIRFLISTGLTVLGILAAVVMMRRREPGTPLTWAGACVAAVLVFALMILGYAVVPHDWLTWADTSAFGGLREDKILLDTYPIEFTGRTVRDVVVTVIYVAATVVNIVLWSKWQRRGTPKPPPAAKTPAPAGVSAFGRPVTRRGD